MAEAPAERRGPLGEGLSFPLCGEAFVPALSSGAALTHPARDMFADVPPRPPSWPSG